MRVLFVIGEDIEGFSRGYQIPIIIFNLIRGNLVMLEKSCVCALVALPGPEEGGRLPDDENTPDRNSKTKPVLWFDAISGLVKFSLNPFWLPKNSI